MSLILTTFVFNNRYANLPHPVQIYSAEEGGNSKVVLEDVASVLLAQPGKYADEEELIAITEEKIRLASITPIKHNSLHLATVDQMEEFYVCCDELGDYGEPSVYHSFGVWWAGILRPLIEKQIAHVGPLVSRVPVWEKDQSKARRIFGADAKKEMTLRKLLERYFNLNVDWILSVLVDKTKLRMSYIYRGTTGEAPSSSYASNGFGKESNTYTPEMFVAVTPDIENLLGNPISLVKDAFNNQRVSDQIETQKQEVKKLKLQGKSTDEIIKQVWEVTPNSHLIEAEEGGKYRNYQYELLKTFVELISIS